MISTEKKAEIIKDFEIHPGDTGSPEVQIALMSARIHDLQGHLNTHKHDEGSRHGLLALVGKRRRLLAYLRDNEPERYRTILKRLGLRR